MRNLIAYAAGFIGSHLTKTLLAEGACVGAIGRYNSRDDRGSLAEGGDR